MNIGVMRQLHIIDTLGPFALPNDREVINWSKVDFTSLETNGRLSAATRRKIVQRFEGYIAKIAKLGYDSISIDDLAHMAVFDFYHLDLRQLLADYRQLYGQLFAIAKSHGLKIFVNTDYLFFNDDITWHLKESGLTPTGFYTAVLQQAFATFPEIDGVILRVGENDGKDVEGSFLSRLLLKTPRQANELLTHILPIFEQQKKTLIFRTWTVGVYKIGDLIWNEKTFDAVFGSIKSDALIISMKFGDTDFMRYLHLNPLFGRGQHKKIIELQTRREWEGMGELASFVGWDYQQYLQQLKNNKNVIGMHVWCQTGGWAKSAWSATTYFDKRSFWNELNTEVTIGITKHKQTVEQAIEQFCAARGVTQTEEFTRLLRLADEAVLKGLYLPAMAEKPLYFRRSRIPPLTWLTWDRVHLPAVVMYLHQLLVRSPDASLRDANDAVEATRQMVDIAKSIRLPAPVIRSLEFEHDTFVLFAQLKRYMFGLLSGGQIQKLNAQVQAYEKHYPQHYSIPKLQSSSRRRKPPRSLLKLLIRDTLSYRKRDKAMLKTSPAQARLVRLYLRRSKSHLADQSMGFEAFFK
jgi:hypothetical protein